MSLGISGSASQTMVREQSNDIKQTSAKFEAQFDFIQQKLAQHNKPSIEQPAPPTWPGANSMLSNIGEVMLLLAKVGIALRDQQREMTKTSHDAAVVSLEKSAKLTRDQAAAAFVTAIVSFALAVGLSALSIKAQKSSNAKMTKADNLTDQAALMQKQGVMTASDTTKFNNLGKQASALQKSGGLSATYATTYSQTIMASGQVVSGIGQGVNLTLEADKKVEEAKGQAHQKTSDLASQDYQEMEKFRSNLVDSLKQIVNMMNEIVKTTTQV